MPGNQLLQQFRVTEFEVVVVPDQMKINLIVGEPYPFRSY